MPRLARGPRDRSDGAGTRMRQRHLLTITIPDLFVGTSDDAARQPREFSPPPMTLQGPMMNA